MSVRIKAPQDEIMRQVQPGLRRLTVQPGVRVQRIRGAQEGEPVMLRIKPVRPGRADGIQQLVVMHAIVGAGPGQRPVAHEIEARDRITDRAGRRLRDAGCLLRRPLGRHERIGTAQAGRQ